MFPIKVRDTSSTKRSIFRRLTMQTRFQIRVGVTLRLVTLRLTKLAMFPNKNRVTSYTSRFFNLRLTKLAMSPIKVRVTTSKPERIGWISTNLSSSSLIITGRTTSLQNSCTIISRKQ